MYFGFSRLLLLASEDSGGEEEGDTLAQYEMCHLVIT